MAKKTARKFYRLPEFSEAVKAGILPEYVNRWGFTLEGPFSAIL